MDLEEAKAQEIDMSRFSLQTSPNKFDETNALPLEEHYAVPRTIAVHPAVIEISTPISDTEKVENLNAEVKKLKVMISTSELFYLPIFNFTQFKCMISLKFNSRAKQKVINTTRRRLFQKFPPNQEQG